MRTRSFLRSGSLVISIIAAVACDSPTIPGNSGPTIVSAERGLPQAPVGATTPPTVSGTSGAIVVLGTIRLPMPCYSMSVNSTRSGNQVTIRVIATFVGQGCIQAVAEFDYRATVPMPRGTYEVTIEHHDALPPPVTYVVGKSTVRVIF